MTNSPTTTLNIPILPDPKADLLSLSSTAANKPVAGNGIPTERANPPIAAVFVPINVVCPETISAVVPIASVFASV